MSYQIIIYLLYIFTSVFVCFFVIGIMLQIDIYLFLFGTTSVFVPIYVAFWF